MSGKRFLGLATVVLILISALTAAALGDKGFWKLWGFPVMSPHFADLRNLAGGAESIAEGHDPLFKNPGDPWKRRMNQPRIVQHIVSVLKFDQNAVTPVGILFGLLFFCGLFIFCRPFDIRTALFVLLVAFSPAVMLGLERGNHDLFIFFLLSLALASPSVPLAAAILLLSAFIKFFPVFGAGYFFRCERKPFWRWTGGFAALFAIYLLVNRDDLKHIFAATQRGFGTLAYGSRSLVDLPLTQALVPSLALIALAGLAYLKRLQSNCPAPSDEGYYDAFRVGAGIYVGTFLLGNNWDYRQMFLIFTIPQLTAWMKDGPFGYLAAATLASVVTVCWGNLLLPALAEEILEWLLLVAMSHLFFCALPAWMQADIAGFFARRRFSKQEPP